MLQRITNSAVLVVVVAMAAIAAQQRGTPPTIPSQPAGPSSQNDWRGWARCTVDVQGKGYVDQQIHTWTLSGGAPRIEGAFRIYPATWSVVGGGSMQRPQGLQTRQTEWATNVQEIPAPLAVFVRASDGRLLISARHSQLRSSGAVAGYDQLTGSTTPQAAARISGDAFEIAFPSIEGDAKARTLAGSSTPGANGSIGYLQQAGSRISMECTWQFGQGESVPKPPPYVEVRAVPTPSPGKPPVTRSMPPTAPGGPITPDTNVTPEPVKPTGPPPSGFKLNADRFVAQLTWDRPRDDFSVTFQLFRSFGSQSPVEIPLPRDSFFGAQPTSYTDQGLDPGVYRYRLIANYGQTWGEATATYTAPPFVNPARFRATKTFDTVKLEWDAAPGALKYRVDGTTLPVTGKEVTATELTISPIRGIATWQLAAIYPGDRADFANRPVVTTISTPVPTHSPAYLSKSNGPGNAVETLAHYTKLCNWRNQGCAGFNGIAESWGVDLKQGEKDAVRYTNETDLGGPRQTHCVFGKPSNQTTPVVDSGGALVCYATSLGTVSLIVMTPEGARFAVFNINQPENPYDPYGPGATIDLVPTAIFDSEGPKNPPFVCLSCHGGTYDSTTKLVKGASLLPIDPSLVHLQQDDTASQERIRIINSMIRQTYSSAAVGAYIDGLYGGMDGNRHKVDQPGTLSLPNYVPSGWNTQRSLYLDFVKKDCAMCHLAGSGNLNFLSAGNLLSNKDLVHTAVCKARSMPHAETSFLNFWTRSAGPVSGPGWFAAALGFSSCNAN